MFLSGDWSRLQFEGGYGNGIFSEQTQSRRHNHQQLRLVLENAGNAGQLGKTWRKRKTTGARNAKAKLSRIGMPVN